MRNKPIIYIKKEKYRSNASISYYLTPFFHKISFPFYVILSLILIISSKNEAGFVKTINSTILKTSAPFIYIIELPINSIYGISSFSKFIIMMKKENNELKEENDKLRNASKQLEYLRKDNQSLKELLDFADNKEYTRKIANIIGDAQGIYSNNLIINIGRKNNITLGNIVAGNQGIIGRIIDIFENKSRILLLTDIKSKIPVITSVSGTRGILVGKNDKNPEIIYLDKDHKVEIEELVFTSGDGEAIPEGLLVGKVKEIYKRSAEVKIAEDISNIKNVLVFVDED